MLLSILLDYSLLSEYLLSSGKFLEKPQLVRCIKPNPCNNVKLTVLLLASGELRRRKTGSLVDAGLFF